MQDVIIDLSAFYTSNAKLSELDSYIQKARDLAGNGNEVVLTGTGPNWFDIVKIIEPQKVCSLWAEARKYIRVKSIKEGMDFACTILQ